VRYILEAVNHGLDMPLAQGQFLETALFGAIASTEDTREGTPRSSRSARRPGRDASVRDCRCVVVVRGSTTS
jgi:hypothetical protein